MRDRGYYVKLGKFKPWADHAPEERAWAYETDPRSAMYKLIKHAWWYDGDRADGPAIQIHTDMALNQWREVDKGEVSAKVNHLKHEDYLVYRRAWDEWRAANPEVADNPKLYKIADDYKLKNDCYDEQASPLGFPDRRNSGKHVELSEAEYNTDCDLWLALNDPFARMVQLLFTAKWCVNKGDTFARAKVLVSKWRGSSENERDRIAGILRRIGPTYGFAIRQVWEAANPEWRELFKRSLEAEHFDGKAKVLERYPGILPYWKRWWSDHSGKPLSENEARSVATLLLKAASDFDTVREYEAKAPPTPDNAAQLAQTLTRLHKHYHTYSSAVGWDKFHSATDTARLAESAKKLAIDMRACRKAEAEAQKERRRAEARTRKSRAQMDRARSGILKAAAERRKRRAEIEALKAEADADAESGKLGKGLGRWLRFSTSAVASTSAIKCRTGLWVGLALDILKRRSKCLENPCKNEVKYVVKLRKCLLLFIYNWEETCSETPWDLFYTRDHTLNLIERADAAIAKYISGGGKSSIHRGR